MEQKKIQIRRERDAENPDCTIYFSKQVLTRTKGLQFYKFASKGQNLETGEQVELDVLAEEVLTIDGIQFMAIFPYYIVVLKAKMWEWDEIDETKILKLLTSFNLEALEDRGKTK